MAIAERERLARDLHDAVTQTLFSAHIIAGGLPDVWQHNPEHGQQGLVELEKLTRNALAEMRTLIVELRPITLTEKPLSQLLTYLTEAVSGQIRIPITLTHTHKKRLPPQVQIALYRITQETLNNVVKHAQARQVWIELDDSSDQIRLSIRDNGRGFDLNEVLPGGAGLAMMCERAENIGALVTVKSQPNQGTQIDVIWPHQTANKDK